MKSKVLTASLLTVTGLFGLLIAILILVCVLAEIPVLYALIGGIVVLLLQFLLGPWLTDLNMKWVYKAKFDAELPDYLVKFITEICEKENMKFPKIGYIDDGAPNAFTYGRTKNDARVILSRGIFEMLDKEEVKAVTAHELGHAVHYDILIMTVAQLIPMVLYAIYKACMESKSSSDNSSKDKSGGSVQIAGIIAYVLYLISQYVILWLSRTREYYADSYSASVTQNPNALASALVEIGFGLSTKTNAAKEGQTVTSRTMLGISDKPSSIAMAVSSYQDGEFNKQSIKNAMKWDLWNVWASYYELNSTHPLISKRLLALSKQSQDYGQEPYIVFDEQKPESYADDFLKELFITVLPWMMLIIGLIIVIPMGNIKYSGLVLLLPVVASLFKYGYIHPNKTFSHSTVRDLLGIVKVSEVTSVPTELSGVIIGRGNPGCVFDEDFVIRDETGIMLLDYDQPLFLVNKIFALFKSPQYFDKDVRIRGYYRRSPVPYIQLKEIEIDGKVKKCYTITFGWIWRWALLALSIIFSILMISGIVQF